MGRGWRRGNSAGAPLGSGSAFTFPENYRRRGIGEVVEVGSLGNIRSDLIDLTLDNGLFDDLRIEDLGGSLQVTFLLGIILYALH